MGAFGRSTGGLAARSPPTANLFYGEAAAEPSPRRSTVLVCWLIVRRCINVLSVVILRYKSRVP